MKFAIRDDDLNWFYTPEFIDENLSYIWDICPVSMSVIPYVKGNWKKNVELLEKLGPTGVSKLVIEQISADTDIYPISDNKPLVDYIKSKVKENKIYLTIHGIYHRNSDASLPVLNKNFAIGAEFFTDQDLSIDLKNACTYLEETFNQKIKVFTPPQNIVSELGYVAIKNNGLDVCAYPPTVKRPVSFIKQGGLINYIECFKHKLFNRGSRTPLPNTLDWKGVMLVDHCSLQPNSDIEKIKMAIDDTYNAGGDFVLSTHSYAFKTLMDQSPDTMGQVLLDILEYAKTTYDVEFVTIDKIFN